MSTTCLPVFFVVVVAWLLLPYFGVKKDCLLVCEWFYYRVAVLPVIDILPVNLKCSVQKHATTDKKLGLAVKNVF